MNKTLAIIIVVSLLWIWAGASFQQSENATKEWPEVHFKAPGFTLPSLDGKSFSTKDTKGKPLVINFWASWCGPCKDEVPELIELYKKHQGEFNLYGVDLTSTDTMGAMKAFVRDYNINYPVLLDKKGKVAELYNINAFPTTYLVNTDGMIVKKIRGYAGDGKLKKEIESLISNG